MKNLLAYLHPVIQVAVLIIAFATLRLGLALKRHRTGQRRLQARRFVFRRHILLGSLGVATMTAGYLFGVVSMALFRQQAPFRSAHFFFGTLALLLFLGVAYTGWRLKRRTRHYADVRDIHGFLVYLGLFVALGVAVMGFILLP